MPYNSVSELPDNVKERLDESEQRQWMEAFNSAFDTYDGDEGKAMAVANAAVKKIDAKIVKVSDEQRMVYGWASVISVNGEAIVDKQGDMIEPETLEKAATDFMMSVRMAKAMHEGGKVGEVVHSLPLTKGIAQSLGILSPMEGWVIAMKIHDDSVWQRVKSGELRAFSIGGKGVRNAV